LSSTEEMSSAPEDLSLYQFQPLEGPDKIRVLELQPATEDLFNLKCRIYQINHYEGGYQSLSYVWGSEKRPYRMTVVDEAGVKLGYIPLTYNLKNALYDLRNTIGLENMVFWIDQVCINQEGAERNHQVELMGQIYQNAAQVITYLGPAAAADLEAEIRGVQLLERIYEHFKPSCDKLIRTGNLHRSYVERAKLPVKDLPDDLFHEIDLEVDFTWKWLTELGFGEWTT